MNEQDYRSKYLKYKQKYTNALQNMQGGGNSELQTALTTQPTAVYVVDKSTYDKLRLPLQVTNDVGIENLPSQYNEEVVKTAISNINPDCIRILPMTDFKKESTAYRTLGIKIGKDKIEFTKGLEKVNGHPAPTSTDSPFGGLAKFGQNVKNKYDVNSALTHLKNGINYFSQICKLVEPSVLILNGKNLHFCGKLEPNASAVVAKGQDVLATINKEPSSSAVV